MILLLNACGSNETSTKSIENNKANELKLTVEQEKNAGINFCQVESSAMQAMLQTTGKIELPPENKISISIPLSGYIKSTRILPGMSVQKGEVLAIIEDMQYIQLQEDYLVAKAQLAFSEQEYKRQVELNRTKASSDKVLEQAKSTYQVQLVQTKSLAQKLALLGINIEKISSNTISKSIQIKSPINGFVSQTSATVGKHVNPDEQLFEIYNSERLLVKFTYYEKDVNSLEVGLPIVAQTNGLDSVQGKILFINRSFNQPGRSEVICSIESSNAKLAPGMFVSVFIQLNNHNALSIPNEAIVHHEGKDYIFVAQGKNHFSMQFVQTGLSNRGKTQLVNGSNFRNKQIVCSGAYNLLMALKNVNTED